MEGKTILTLNYTVLKYRTKRADVHHVIVAERRL